MTPFPAHAGAAREAELTRRWLDGLPPPLRLEDGRVLRVVFPGVPGGGAGPDVRGAILDASGDVLRGDVEVHLHASGWRAHGHHLDDAYAGVVLHVVAANDSGALTTLHASGRAVPVLVAPAAGMVQFPPAFTPPCALHAALEDSSAEVLERLGLRRLRMKAARAAPLVADTGAGQALYALALETLGGPANREPFGALARRLPLRALLERLDGAAAGVPRAFAASAELKGAAAALIVRRAGVRPMASPGRRLEVAAALFANWWPSAADADWPDALTPGAALPTAPGLGLGRHGAIEVAVNAMLPVALAAGAWPEAEVEAAWRRLPSPGTYGKLRRLEHWLGGQPFAGAGRLQGGILLHSEWCTRGGCGCCPLSS